jgi:hypothetical protein
MHDLPPKIVKPGKPPQKQDPVKIDGFIRKKILRYKGLCTYGPKGLIAKWSLGLRDLSFFLGVKVSGSRGLTVFGYKGL